MQGGGGGRQGLFGFGDPFAGLGGLGRPGSLMSNVFGGANAFDDPFFTNPFGGMMPPSFPNPFGSMMQPSFPNPFGGMMQPSFPNPFGSMMQPGLLAPSLFGPLGDPSGGIFGPRTVLNQGISNAGGFSQQAPEPSRPKGPIIKELSSDDEDDADGNGVNEKKEGDVRKHPRESKEPYVEDPDEEVEENGRPKRGKFMREFNVASTSCPQPQSFMFQSSTVTYGGRNGACYTSSTSRRTGGDGITLEESKEADIATGKATHRISRGMGSKGHSLTRKLNSDGQVNTLQTLHNLNQDELAGFEESWRRNAGENLPGWNPQMNMPGNDNAGIINPNLGDANGVPALPAPDQSRGPNSSKNSLNGCSKGRTGRS